MLKKDRSFFTLGLLTGIFISVAYYAFLLRDQDANSLVMSATTLKLGHHHAVSHPVHQALELMAERLVEYSDGKMSLEIYPGGVLGSETEAVEQLQQGVLAMTKTSAAVLETFSDDMKVFGLPYLFRDSDHYWKVLESEVGQEILDSLDGKQLVGMTYFDAGSRNFYSSERFIRSPDDLKGMKIRVMNSRMAIDMVTELGGSPTPIAWGELYSALAQGTVDGAENNPPSYVSNKHYEVGDKFSFDEHTRIPDVLLMSQKIWDSLSAKEKDWLAQATADANQSQRALWLQETERAIAEAEASGAAFIYPDKTPFEQKVAPIYEKLSQTSVGKLAERVKAIQ